MQGGMRRVECETSSGSRLFLVSLVNFFAKMACFSSGSLLIVTVLICGCRGRRGSFSCLFAPVFVSCLSHAFPTSFLDARVARMGQ